MVRSRVQETLNGMFDAEADRLYQAKRNANGVPSGFAGSELRTEAADQA